MDHEKLENGLPAGSSFLKVAIPREGEWYIDCNGKLAKSSGLLLSRRAIIQFTHGYGNMPLEDVPVPAGERLLGGSVATACGVPKRGEQYIGRNGTIVKCGSDYAIAEFLRLEPKQETSRFLIMADWKIVEEFDGKPGTITESAASALVKSHPSLYKIVERPE